MVVSTDASAVANSRLHDLLSSYREEWLSDEIEPYLSQSEWQAFGVERRNVASAGDMGAMILGLVLPLYFVIMVAVGCMYPAVDSTAGERERNTWETTLTMAVPRLSVVAAKYLYVTTLGFVAGALNLGAMTLTMGSVIAPLLGDQQGAMEFRVPLAAIPLLLERLAIKGALVTIDAIGTQTDIAAKILEKGGDYLLALKANRPLMHAEVARFFADPPQSAVTTFETTDGDHGRLEIRRHTVCQEPNATGRSRHGEPVRKLHKIPSITDRRSRGGRPVGFGAGNKSAIILHCSSVSRYRSMMNSFHQST